jgi:hypothetical protein
MCPSREFALPVGVSPSGKIRWEVLRVRQGFGLSSNWLCHVHEPGTPLCDSSFPFTC